MKVGTKQYAIIFHELTVFYGSIQAGAAIEISKITTMMETPTTTRKKKDQQQQEK